MDLLGLLSNMGLDTAWLPLLVALVAIPTQYLFLGMSAHQEYREVIGGIASTNAGLSTRERYIRGAAASELRIFELDWWIVSAFAILVALIILSGNLGDWTQLQSATPTTVSGSYRCISQAVDRLVCSSLPKDASSNVKAIMSLYATIVSLLVGFRLGWARLRLAKHLANFHVGVRQRQAKKVRKMPPSGYDLKQSSYLRDFLMSCAGALLNEAHNKGLHLTSALFSEVDDISQHLREGLGTPVQRATLELTKAFYQRIAASSPADEKSFYTAARTVSNQICTEIMSIKLTARIGA